MALTWKRWLATALLAGAMIAVWLMPVHDPASWARSRTRGVYVADYGYVPRYGWPDAGARLAEANLHLRILEVRDSVFTPRVLAGATSGLEVLIDRQFPDSIRRAMTGVFETAWHAYDAGDRFPVVVALVEDTATKLDGLPIATNRWVYASVFPPDSTTSVCRVVARVRVDLKRQRASEAVNYVRRIVMEQLTSQFSGRTVLGPCAVYATFGTPGPRVAQWLAQTAWRYGRTVDWNRESRRFVDMDFRGFGSPEPAVDFTGLSSPAWQMRSELSDNGIACIAGDGSRCVSGLLEPAFAMPDDSSWRAGVIDIGNPWITTRWAPSISLGPSSEWLLSDLVHELGRQRFEVFWRSNATVPAAFEAATGGPLSAWLERWARRTYGPDVLGPAIPGRGRLAGFLVLLAGLVVSMVFAMERRVA